MVHELGLDYNNSLSGESVLEEREGVQRDRETEGRRDIEMEI